MLHRRVLTSWAPHTFPWGLATVSFPLVFALPAFQLLGLGMIIALTLINQVVGGCQVHFLSGVPIILDESLSLWAGFASSECCRAGSFSLASARTLGNLSATAP